jgi:hypothetical protein
MLKIEDLIKHLSENNLAANPARQTFLNFLSHLTDHDEAISSEHLETFFCTCLDYAHWQQNRKQLTEEIRDLLGNRIDFSDLKWPDETQIIELESTADLTDALQIYLNLHYKKGEKYRLILEPDKKVMAVILNADHSITIRSFDRKMVIRHGQLEPLKKDFCLHYTADLELDPARIQKLELAPFVTAQFRAGTEALKGSLIRGYLCQKFFELEGENIASYPKLFYAIKRVEKHFIHRQTDPFYQQTISNLEKTIQSVRLGDPEAIESSMDVLAQAQNALDYVFADDKLLGLLIRDLQHTLSLRRGRADSRVVRTPQKVEESWNQKLKQPLFQRREPKSASINSSPTVELQADELLID